MDNTIIQWVMVLRGKIHAVEIEAGGHQRLGRIVGVVLLCGARPQRLEANYGEHMPYSNIDPRHKVVCPACQDLVEERYLKIVSADPAALSYLRVADEQFTMALLALGNLKDAGQRLGINWLCDLADSAGKDGEKALQRLRNLTIRVI